MRFHRLVALSFEREGKRTYWFCRCDCGGEIRIETNNLRRADRKPSCGCQSREITSATNSTHRMTGSPVYRSWASMKRRCYAPLDLGYENYGGRGITVCERWRHSFERFFEDMGHPPSRTHTLDRIDPNGNYEPDNCRWADKKTQARNTRRNVRYAFDGRQLTLPEISEITGVGEVTIRKRLQAGHPIAVAASKFNLRYGSVIQSLRR